MFFQIEKCITKYQYWSSCKFELYFFLMCALCFVVCQFVMRSNAPLVPSCLNACAGALSHIDWIVVFCSLSLCARSHSTFIAFAQRCIPFHSEWSMKNAFKKYIQYMYYILSCMHLAIWVCVNGAINGIFSISPGAIRCVRKTKMKIRRTSPLNVLEIKWMQRFLFKIYARCAPRYRRCAVSSRLVPFFFSFFFF